MNHSAAREPATAQVVLGLFIVWQLIFLIGGNLGGVLDRYRLDWQEPHWMAAVAPRWVAGEEHFHDASEMFNGITRRWGELTGQPQNWSLFAPNVAAVSPFPAVELRWDDDPHSAEGIAGRLSPLAAQHPGEVAAWEVAARSSPYPSFFLLSDNEPDNLHSYWRVGRFRLRRYEASGLEVILTSNDRSQAEVADAWRERIENKVRRDGECIKAYLRWRERVYQREHLDRPPPRQLVLWVRQYAIPAPDAAPIPWQWQVLPPYPIARWRPHVPPPANCLDIEMYHPVLERFQYLVK
ncbi:MAG: hypothetical protein ACK4RK_21280 [Gemmataceae bacterium]